MRDILATTPASWYAAKTVKLVVEEPATDLLPTPLSPLPPTSDSSFDEAQKSRKDRWSKKNVSCCNSSMFLSDKCLRFLLKSMKKLAKLSDSSMISNEAKDSASKLRHLHATDSHFWKATNYKTCHLPDKSQLYKGKMPARTTKYAKHMKMLMRAYKFDDNYPIATLRFLTRLKRARNSNGVFERRT